MVIQSVELGPEHLLSSRTWTLSVISWTWQSPSKWNFYLP